MKEELDAASNEQIVSGRFVSGGVVGEPLGLAEDEMRRVEAAEPVDACQEVVGHTVHDLADIAVNVSEQAAERGDAGGGPGSTEKAVPLDQDGLATLRRRRGGGCDTGRSAAKNNNLVVAVNRNAARRLVDELTSDWHRLGASSTNPRERVVLRCFSRAFSFRTLTDGNLPASACRFVLMFAAMPQSLRTCRDPAFSQASIQQIHLRDSAIEYQRGHRVGPRYTILRMHAGNMTSN